MPLSMFPARDDGFFMDLPGITDPAFFALPIAAGRTKTVITQIRDTIG
jgi:hypothetical protein